MTPPDEEWVEWFKFQMGLALGRVLQRYHRDEDMAARVAATDLSVFILNELDGWQPDE